MIALLKRLDRAVELVIDWVCVALLSLIVLIVLYTVIMRYVFLAPPFWGDVVAMFANIGMVLLGISVAVRQRDLIAMQALYERIGTRMSLILELLWMAMIVVFAAIFTVFGYEAASHMPGMLWELGMMPQKYPMMIVPISGALLLIASIRVLIEDILRLRKALAGATGKERLCGTPLGGPHSKKEYEP